MANPARMTPCMNSRARPLFFTAINTPIATSDRAATGPSLAVKTEAASP